MQQQYNSRNQTTLTQPAADQQQFLKQLTHTAINGYGGSRSYVPPPNQNQGVTTTLTAGAINPAPTEQGGLGTPGSRPPMGAANIKGAMLPPPPPGAAPGTSNNNGPNSAKSTPVLAARTKEGSSPGGIEGVSPENARPASRPIPGSTPQAISAPTTPANNPITGSAVTPGRPSTMSAPSPSQLMQQQQQQSSRPQSQSPSGLSISRAPASTPLQAAPNPSAIQAQNYQTAGASLGGLNGMPNANNGSVPTPSSLMPVALGNPGAALTTGDPGANDIFGMGTMSALDLQMMSYPEDTFGQSMGLDFSLPDDFYTTYIDEATLDSVSGP
jgi:hypothetical protein